MLLALPHALPYPSDVGQSCFLHFAVEFNKSWCAKYQKDWFDPITCNTATQYCIVFEFYCYLSGVRGRATPYQQVSSPSGPPFLLANRTPVAKHYSIPNITDVRDE